MPKLSLAKLERHLYAAADILRREGMDAATYKDFIFGMLFLKRCSDVFDAERDNIVGRKVEQGMIRDEAIARYGENPDFYNGFFGAHLIVGGGAHPVIGGEDSVAGCAFQPVISGRDARAPREGAAWERGRPARILGLHDELLYSLKVFCQILTS